MGHEVTVCPDGLTAVAALETQHLRLHPGRSRHARPVGIEVIAKGKELSPQTEAIVLTGKSSLETAVAALRHGAFDYLTKPCKLVELQALLNRVAAKARADAQISGRQTPLGNRRRQVAAHRQLARHRSRAQTDRQSRADRFHRPDPGRNRHRQGAGRPRGSRSKRPGRHALRGHQLRRTCPKA